jgi:phosphate uptake regulator
MRPESRKIQITGGSTFIVSLPKEWARGQGLHRGDTVGLWPQEDGSIVISPQLRTKHEEPTIVLRVDDLQPSHVLRELISAYQAGFGLVELRTKGPMPPEFRAVAREFAARVIGPEVVEETGESITVQDLLDPGDLPLRRSFRRMILIASSMVRDAVTAFRSLDIALAEDVIERDNEVDRLYWLIAKQYNQILRDVRVAAQLGLTPIDALAYRSSGKHVERIADHGARIAQNVKPLAGCDLPAATLKKIESFAAVAIDMFGRSIEALDAGNSSLANETIDQMENLYSARNRLIGPISKTTGEAGISLAYVVDSIERIGSYSTDIAEIALNHTAIAASGSTAPP